MKNKIIILIIIWASIAILAGYFNIFNVLPKQFFGVYIFATIFSLMFSFFRNKEFQAYINTFSLKANAFVHIFRIAAGFLFLHYSNLLPEMFVNKAAYGDIIAGILAISVFAFGQKKITYYIFNFFGIIDLVSAMSIGLYLNSIGNELIGNIFHLPLVLIPGFFVPILLFSHIISIRKLFKMKEITLTQKIN